jgi:membrane protein DedA with SNARE-associated domain
MDLHAFVEAFRALPDAVVLLVLGLSAFVEYIFPPFPGDTAVAGGAVLVAAFGWPVAPVLLATTSGALLGAWCDFAIGRWLVSSGRLARMSPERQATVESIAARMRRHGAIYLAVNRFLPGIRAFFFVAAGVAGLSTGRVLLWAGLSAMAWNALLVGLGFGLGAQVTDLEATVGAIAKVGWLILLLVAGWFLFKYLRSRRAAASRSRTEGDDRR